MRKNILSLMSLGLICFSCSNDINDSITHNIQQKSTYSKKIGDSDLVALKKYSTEGMISFIESLKIHYKDGYSYKDFLNNLDSVNQLEKRTPEGEALLNYSYNFIKSNQNINDVNPKVLVEALKSIVQKNIDKGNNLVSQINLESESLILFGLDESYTTDIYGNKCKWYQLGCHANSVWEWLGSPASGSGSTSNAEVLFYLVSLILLFI